MTISTPSFPLHPLLQEINTAATHGLPFLAIAMTVALPDICVSLASPDGRSSADRYKQWCKDNLGSEFSSITPDDLYSMRCGVLHNGRFGDMKHSVARVVFILPNPILSLQNGRLNDAYTCSIVDFCKNFTQAVAEWFDRNKNDATVEANLPRMMQLRPQGMAPYIVGLPVIA